MAGLLDLFAAWTAETGKSPLRATEELAGRLRVHPLRATASEVEEREARAVEVERIGRILFGPEEEGQG